MISPPPFLDDSLHEGAPRLSRSDRFLMYLYGTDSTSLEWLCAAVKTVWGLWLLLPLHTFASAPTVYRVAASLPEWAWGAAFLALGLAQARAWYVDARLRRWRLALAGTAAWLTWAGLLLIGDHRTSALAVWATLAAFQALAAVWLYGRSHPVRPKSLVRPSRRAGREGAGAL